MWHKWSIFKFQPSGETLSNIWLQDPHGNSQISEVHQSDDNIVIGSGKNGTQLERKRKNDGDDSEGVSKKPKKR